MNSQNIRDMMHIMQLINVIENLTLRAIPCLEHQVLVKYLYHEYFHQKGSGPNSSGEILFGHVCFLSSAEKSTGGHIA